MSRIRVRNQDDFREILIYPRKDKYVEVFLTVWVGFWLIGESTALYRILFYENIHDLIFMLNWVLIWTLAGLYSGLVLLWKRKGRETVRIFRDQLNLSRCINNWCKESTFSLEKVLNLRTNPDDLGPSKGWPLEQFGLVGGVLAFEYEGKTFRFGAHLAQAEASKVLDLINNDITKVST